jgi:catechol 2,3-dioxygenase-like lactoylglutathione lyase family enzyme
VISPRRSHHTGYTVSDLDRSVAFYRDRMGMEVVAQQEKQGGYLGRIVGYPEAHVRMAHLRVPGDDYVLELFEYLAPAGSTPDRIEPCDVGTAHLCIVVDDLPDAYQRLVDAGVDTFISPPVEVDTGINTGGYGIYLRDPDGIVLEIFQPPGGRKEPSHE